MREPSVEVFLKDVSDHKMEIALDSGTYRHLKFKQSNNSWNMHYSLVTWPGYLCICGDMGTWTFARLPDMFDFFRSPREMAINPSYWAEKLQNGTGGGKCNAKKFEYQFIWCLYAIVWGIQKYDMAKSATPDIVASAG